MSRQSEQVIVEVRSADSGKTVGTQEFEFRHEAEQKADFYNYQTQTLLAEIKEGASA